MGLGCPSKLILYSSTYRVKNQSPPLSVQRIKNRRGRSPAGQLVKKVRLDLFDKLMQISKLLKKF